MTTEKKPNTLLQAACYTAGMILLGALVINIGRLILLKSPKINVGTCLLVGICITWWILAWVCFYHPDSPIEYDYIVDQKTLSFTKAPTKPFITFYPRGENPRIAVQGTINGRNKQFQLNAPPDLNLPTYRFRFEIVPGCEGDRVVTTGSREPEKPLTEGPLYDYDIVGKTLTFLKAPTKRFVIDWNSDLENQEARRGWKYNNDNSCFHEDRTKVPITIQKGVVDGRNKVFKLGAPCNLSDYRGLLKITPGCEEDRMAQGSFCDSDSNPREDGNGLRSLISKPTNTAKYRWFISIGCVICGILGFMGLVNGVLEPSGKR